MVKKSFFSLALVLGVVAALVVFVWPTMPVWIGPPGQIQAFSADGKNLYAVHPSSPGGRRSSRQFWLACWNAASGELQEEWPIQWPDGMALSGSRAPGLQISPNRQYLVATVRDVSTKTGGRDYIECLLFSTQAGKATGGLFKVYHLNPGCFSPDGRWLWNYSGPQGGGIEIREAETAKVVLTLAPNFDPVTKKYAQWWDCCFAKDANSVFVSHESWDKGNEPHRLKLCCFELPSGRLLREFGTKEKFRSVRLDGDQLYVECHEPVDPKKPETYHIHTYRLNLRETEPIPEGPLPHLSGFVVGMGPQQICESGVHWIAYHQMNFCPEASLIDKLKCWVRERLGLRFESQSNARMQLRIVEAETGRELANQEFPAWSIELSPAAHWAACTHKDSGAIMVWDAQPGPRWPWAVGTGLLVVAGFVLVGRLFTRKPSHHGGAEDTEKRGVQGIPSSG